LTERQTVAIKAVHRVTAVCHIAQHLLTLIPRLVGQQSAYLAECVPAIPAKRA
jgi:hypothetical protein